MCTLIGKIGMDLMQRSAARFQDSLLPLYLRKQGMYICNGKYFLHKYNALFESTISNKPIQWDFNSMAFKRQANGPRFPAMSLDTLYKARALQLRDEYKYLILAYSGGSDSHNILRTFIDNGIKLDEVWVDMPLNLVEKAGYIPNLSKDASNMVSEWYYAIKPDLDQLRITNPEIKIHLSDPTINPVEEDFEDSTTVVGTMTTYTSIKRYRYIREYVMKISQTQTVALVTGQDKPVPARHTVDGVDYFGFTFKDAATYLKSDEKDRGRFMVEYFYWSADFPAIAVEQAWRLWDYLRINRTETNERFNLHSDPVVWRDRELSFDKIVKTICYPKWDFSRHQVSKTGQLTNGQFSRFVDLHKSQRFIQSWQSNHDKAIAAIGSDHFISNSDPSKKELKSLTNFHILGKL